MGEAYSGLQGKLRRGGKILTYWDQYTAYNREHYEHKYKYVVEVQPNWANILIIDSDFEYFELARTNKKYFIRMAWRQLLHLDFKAIARDYDGIFLSEECVNSLRFVDGLLSSKYESLYGWDVETLAIWGKDAIRGLKMYHVDKSRFDDLEQPEY